MILNISVYVSQVETINLLAETLKWKEISRSIGKSQSQFVSIGGFSTPMYYITYEIETDDNVYKSVIDLTILKSKHLLDYKL